MVKKVTISDREYRLLKRTNSIIQKNVNFLETENKKNRFYYDVLWECYCDSLKRVDNLKDSLNNIHQQLYDETYCSGSLRHELDELNKKYTKLMGEYEATLCKLADAQDSVKKEEEKVKPWSGRIL
ncbi:MAG: hypothetical protein CMB31_01435 [Euryarchaeota archaeon]|nr:hypothetical protein [Euryarchaeota archaeon]|tara:strand:+ start:957 stop:1334 length:378 start_codon:yes stop_codon:yes gene_type:complete